MAINANIFNSGSALIAVSVNRGAPVTLNMAARPKFLPQQGYPAPGWDIGGPSTGNFGPGTNTVSVTTSGVVLPLLTLIVPNMNPGALQTYMIWSLDPVTNNASLFVILLNAGAVFATGTSTGTAQPVSS
ncbi:MAG: hypothetical protein JWM95_4418 [Gemmatimonadetes bacterium]|nr:hypothetical protein [Gemmatimonadota bacterium]